MSLTALIADGSDTRLLCPSALIENGGEKKIVTGDVRLAVKSQRLFCSHCFLRGGFKQLVRLQVTGDRIHFYHVGHGSDCSSWNEATERKFYRQCLSGDFKIVPMKPKKTAPKAAVEPNTELEQLCSWYLARKDSGFLPSPPFALEKCQVVTGVKFFDALERECAVAISYCKGEVGKPPVRLTGLLKDLKNLKVFVTKTRA